MDGFVEDARDIPNYAYTSLPDPATYIRLLSVVSVNNDTPPLDRFHISIINFPLETAPQYHAISYTWGDAEYETEITVVTDTGLRRITVRGNCAEVLQQVAHLKTTAYYWVDAICIDQTNDAEKGSQVALMGTVFGQAERVLACFGMDWGDSEFMAKMLQDFDTHVASAGCSLAVSMTEDHTRTEEKNKCLYHCQEFLEEQSDWNILRLCQELDDFTSHPYFHRIWTLQELFLAQRLSLFIGYQELPLAALLFWWDDVKSQFFFQSRKDHEAGRNTSLLRAKLTSTEEGHVYLENALWNDVLFFIDEGGSTLGTAYEQLLRS